jgi:hypothetical protein
VRFELVGASVVDANKDMGILFIQQPPRLRAINHETWLEVDSIVVGEEGPDNLDHK